jgi:hypothetical protein
VIELEEIRVQQIEQGKSAMKVLFEEGKAFRLEIDDVSFQLIVVRKAVDQVGGVEDHVGIRVIDPLVVIIHFDLTGVPEECKKIEGAFEGWSVYLEHFVDLFQT